MNTKPFLRQDKPPRVIKFRLRIGNEVVGYERWDRGDGSNAQWMYCLNPSGRYPERVWRPEPIYHVDKDRFTGLQDKNGTEGYDEDILEHPRPDNPDVIERNKITWNHSLGMWIAGQWQLNAVIAQGQIIGNIHHHPDLLKTKPPPN